MPKLDKFLLVFSFIFITSSASASYVIIPANGQSIAQQERDEYYCEDWAIQKTGYYPEDYSPEKSSANETKLHKKIIIRFNKIKYSCLKSTGYVVNQK